MDAPKSIHLTTTLIIAACLFFQQTLAFSLAKDLVIAQILYNILKPRIVPLPIPLPFPLKFVKHTHKPYAVPIYSHSLSAHQVGHSYDGALGYNGLSATDDLSHLALGHHDLSSSLSDISYGDHGLSSSLSEYPDISNSYVSGHHDLSTSLSKISGFHLPSLPRTSYDHELSKALSKLSSKGHDISDTLSKYSVDEHDFSTSLRKFSTKDYDLSSSLSQLPYKEKFSKKMKSVPHNIQSIVKELENEPELLHEDTNHIDSIHDDIEAIGGLDILTDLDSLGENEKWW